MITKFIRLCFIAIVTAAIASTPAMAKKEGKKGKSFKTVAVVVNPALCLQSINEGIVFSQEENSGIPGPVMATGVEVSDGQEPPTITPAPTEGWVHCPLTQQDANPNGKGSTFPQYALGVEVCAVDIDDIIEVQLSTPGSALHNDSGPFILVSEAPNPECIRSVVEEPFPVSDALSLDLNVNLPIEFSTFRLILSTKSDPLPPPSP
ncbi:MAG: hypothetical protein ACU826_00005 [Gammaproteobacteria bacterium]